jgi:glyoxylase-like metal-dependent hydrolase (beta-lactamase superfamily II)
VVTAPGMTITGTLQRQAWLDRVLPPVEEVRSGLWSVPVPVPDSPLRYVLMYVLRLPDGVAIVDTGWPAEESWLTLVDGLTSTGHAVTDVRAVLVTHAHADHLGLAERLREASGAWVGLHEADAPTSAGREAAGDIVAAVEKWLHSRGASPDDIASMREEIRESTGPYQHLAIPDVLIEDGSLPLGAEAGLRAIWTPGHTPGHLCFLDERRDVLLSGDHVLPRISPNISRNTRATGDSLRDFLASLEQIAAYEPAEVLPAHEYRFTGLRARVDHLLAHHHARLAEVEDVLTERPGSSTWAVAERLTWSRPWPQTQGMIRQSAVSETFAHLFYLQTSGVVVDRGTDVDTWYVTARSGGG